MAAEELVERVLAGDVEREPLAAPPGPAPHLAQAGDRAGEGDADRRVELADVDPELERVGGDHREQLAGAPAAPRSRAAAAACSRRGRGRSASASCAARRAPRAASRAKRWISSIPRRLRRKQIVRDAVDDQVGEQLGRLGEHRAAASSSSGRSPAGSRSRSAARPAARRRSRPARNGVADQPLGELDRVGDRRRGEDEPGLGAVEARDPAQAAQDVGDVRAEHAAVGVGLVDDDPARLARKSPQPLWWGRTPTLSMSGLVRTRFERRADLRAGPRAGVSPS